MLFQIGTEVRLSKVGLDTLYPQYRRHHYRERAALREFEVVGYGRGDEHCHIITPINGSPNTRYKYRDDFLEVINA